MAVAEVGSFACPAAGDTVITCARITNPKAIFAWTVGRTLTGGGSDHMRFSAGFATYRGATVQQRWNGFASQDNAGTSNVFPGNGTDALIKLNSGSATTISLHCDLVSMDALSVTISWTTRTTNAIVNYILFTGDDAIAGDFTSVTSPSTQDINVTGFTGAASWTGQPDLLLFLMSWDGPADGTYSNPTAGDIQLGFGIKDSGANGRSWFISSDGGAGTQATIQRITNALAVRTGNFPDAGTSAVSFQLSADSAWPANGFEVTYTAGEQDSAVTFWTLALQFPSDVTVTHGEGSAPTAGGLPVAQTLTSADDPDLLFLLHTRQTTANAGDTTSADSMMFGVGAADGAGTERYAGASDDDAAATSVCGVYQTDAKAIQLWTPPGNALDAEADGLVNGSNFELSWNDIAPSAFLYEWFALGVAGAGPAPEIPVLVMAPPIPT